MLADNAAITVYVEARWPDPPLLGATPAEKAEIASWNWRVEFEGLLAIAEALRNSSPAMANRALPGAVDYPQIPALAERGLARVAQFFHLLNERLAGRDWIMGSDYTMVDIATFPWIRNLIDFYAAGELVGFADFPNVRRVLDAFLARPAVQRGLSIPSA